MKKITFSTAFLEAKIAPWTPVQKAGLFVATLLVLGGAFYFLLFKDQVAQIAKTKASIAEQEKRLVDLKQAAAKVDVLQKEVIQSEEELKLLLSFLPDKKEIPGLLESISRLGAQVGLENILFQPQPEQPRDFHAAIPVRLDLVGTYHELGVFLDSVSKLDRILKVQSISLSRPRDRKSADLQVNCTIETYRFVEQPEGTVPKGGAAKGAAPKKK